MEVAVVGATEFVGEELVCQLVEAGYRVRAVVRDATLPGARSLLAAANKDFEFQQGPGQCRLTEGHILQLDSIAQAVRGSTHIFHCASPFIADASDIQSEELQKGRGTCFHCPPEPAVDETRNVMLAAAGTADTLQRVVMTSSVAAIHDKECSQPPKNGKQYTEEDWNDTNYAVDGESHWACKAQAEKEAWCLAKEYGIDLITIVPAFVMGPVLTREVASSCISALFIKGFLDVPNAAVPSGHYIISDVREVAAAHILAATQPNASGRYIVVSPTPVDSRGITDVIKAHFPALDVPDGDSHPAKNDLDSSKVQQDLGLKYRSVEETIRDMVRSIINIAGSPMA